jgi:hypothetical protein
MEVFYIAVLTIAAAILILILTTIGVAMRNGNREVEWPPGAGRCPDGWEEDESTPSKCYIPIDKTNSGTVFSTEVAVNNSGGTGTTSATKYTFVPNNFKGIASPDKNWSERNAWHEVGSATIIHNYAGSGSDAYAAYGAILRAQSGYDFKYFKENDQIAIELLTTKTNVDNKSNGEVLTNTEKTVPEYHYFLVSGEPVKDFDGSQILRLKRDTSAQGISSGKGIGYSDSKPVIAKIDTDTNVKYEASGATVRYFGKRISVDFSDAKYYSSTDNAATKCLRKAWANANEIKWDGISNYNKCA